jgi:hypothetical protein
MSWASAAQRISATFLRDPKRTAMADPPCVSARGRNVRVRLKGQGDMVKYLWTGAAVAAFLVMPVAAPAVDLSLTSIYQGRPVAAATGWALAERWTIYSGIETARVVPAQGIANNRQAWSTSAGYIMLTRWSLKGEYDYVNLLEPGVADTPASTTIAKTGMPLNRRTLKVGGNYDF